MEQARLLSRAYCHGFLLAAVLGRPTSQAQRNSHRIGLLPHCTFRAPQLATDAPGRSILSCQGLEVAKVLFCPFTTCSGSLGSHRCDLQLVERRVVIQIVAKISPSCRTDHLLRQVCLSDYQQMGTKRRCVQQKDLKKHRIREKYQQFSIRNHHLMVLWRVDARFNIFLPKDQMLAHQQTLACHQVLVKRESTANWLGPMRESVC